MTSIDPVIVVVGPTASGKTDLAQLIALSVDGEVVSADSMQVYRGMDIGTGKLPVKERLVVHHGFDLVDPGEPYSAALFKRMRAVASRISLRAESGPCCAEARAFTCEPPSTTTCFPKASKSTTRFATDTTRLPESKALKACGGC